MSIRRDVEEYLEPRHAPPAIGDRRPDDWKPPSVWPFWLAVGVAALVIVALVGTCLGWII